MSWALEQSWGAAAGWSRPALPPAKVQVTGCPKPPGETEPLLGVRPWAG